MVLNGDVRTTMFGADYSKGSMVAGVSRAHSRGLGNYAGVDTGRSVEKRARPESGRASRPSTSRNPGSGRVAEVARPGESGLERQTSAIVQEALRFETQILPHGRERKRSRLAYATRLDSSQF